MDGIMQKVFDGARLKMQSAISDLIRKLEKLGSMHNEDHGDRPRNATIKSFGDETVERPFNICNILYNN